jgi:hypothetical protein
MEWETMIKNKEESKDCKEKTMKDKKNKGYKEPKDPLTEKAPRHQAVALSKDVISDEVAISPTGNDKIEKEDTSQALVKELEAISDDTKDRAQIEETITLRFEDTGEFLDTLKKFETENDLELAMDFDADSYIIGVPIDMVDAFRKFMDENDIKEITDTKEIDERIAEVQSGRSVHALAIDNSMTAGRVGSKEDEEDLAEWLKHPNRLDLVGVDTKAEEE